jgi:acyl-CoA thioesterase-1
VKHVLLVLCLSLLAGCRASQRSQPQTSTVAEAPEASSQATSTPQPNPAVSKPDANDTRLVIVAFGDSLTAGYGTDPGHSYPDYLQQDLASRGYEYHVVNAGISGNTTKDGVDRLPDVLALHPHVVIVAFGGNDGLRGIPIADSRKNLETIVQTLQHAHVKVLLGGITLPPNYGRDYIAQFDATYQMLAHKYHAPLLPFLLKGAYGVPGSMQADGIHATAQGNQQVARNLLPLLVPLLHKQ